MTVPVSMIAGRYDLFIAGQLRDFTTSRENGNDARITIGPWPHASLQVGGYGVRESIEFGLALATGNEPRSGCT